MAKPGRRPTPTETLKLRGSWRADTRKDEPKPTPGRPTCPTWLDAKARSMWREVVPILDGMGVLTLAERNVIARYCTLWSRWRDAEATIREDGPVIDILDGDGRVKYRQQHPAVGMANKLATLLSGLEGDLGLSPAARTRIVAKAPEKSDATDKARFFKNAGE